MSTEGRAAVHDPELVTPVAAQTAGRWRLSARDQEKPLILIGAMLIGLAVNRIAGGWEPLLDLVKVGVFFVIFAVMLPVELTEVGRAFRKIKPTGIALAINFAFIPAFAWAMGWLILRPYPDAWAGVILYTLTPCIGWYLIFTDLAEGDVPWGVALLPWNITLQVALMPVYMYLLVGRVVPLDLATVAESVGLFLVLPFGLALAVQRLAIHVRGREAFAAGVKRVTGELKLWALVVVIIAMFASQRALGTEDIGAIALIIAVLALFFLALFVVALVAGRVAGLPYAENVTLAFTTTARNSEAVIGVAVAAFPGRPLVYSAIILGPVVELPVLLLMARALLGLRDRWWRNVPPAPGFQFDQTQTERKAV